MKTSQDFYLHFFSLPMKRFMFCLICELKPWQFRSYFHSALIIVKINVKTKHDAYIYCHKYGIKGFETGYMLQNTFTENDFMSLTEKCFLHSDKALESYYNAFVYNENPPLKEIASISWAEIIICLWKWMLLSKQEKAIFKF